MPCGCQFVFVVFLVFMFFVVVFRLVRPFRPRVRVGFTVRWLI